MIRICKHTEFEKSGKWYRCKSCKLLFESVPESISGINVGIDIQNKQATDPRAAAGDPPALPEIFLLISKILMRGL